MSEPHGHSADNVAEPLPDYEDAADEMFALGGETQLLRNEFIDAMFARANNQWLMPKGELAMTLAAVVDTANVAMETYVKLRLIERGDNGDD